MKALAIQSQLRTMHLDRAIEFYTQVLGFDLHYHTEDAYAGIGIGNYSVQLKKVDSPDPGVLFVHSGHHFHLWVQVDDVEGAYNELKARGVEIVSPPHENPWGTRELVIRDPDGHVLFLAQN